MYEMRIGPACTVTGLGWHVIPRAQAVALCGQVVPGPAPDPETREERHCAACMEAVRQVMSALASPPSLGAQ